MRRPDLVTDPAASEAFAREVAATSRGVSVWSLGGSGILLKSGDTTLVIDPYLSNHLGDQEPDAPAGWRDRNTPPPVRPEDLTGLSAIFVSHAHGDHCDPETLPKLHAANPSARLIAPKTLHEQLTTWRIAKAVLSTPKSDVEERVGNWSFEAIPAAHVPPDAPRLSPDDAGGHDQVGYLITLGGVRVYHAGDTVVYDGLFERLTRRVEVAVLPINGRRWSPKQPARRANLDYEEAADLAAIVGAKALIPVHYELIGSSARPIEPFLDYAERHYPDLNIHPLSAGEPISFAPSKEEPAV